MGKASSFWNVKNYFMRIDHTQFVSLTTEFKTAVEKEFESPCTTEIKLYKSMPFFSTRALRPEDAKFERESNQRAIGKTAQSIADVTEQDWNRAVYINVTLTPTQGALKKEYAYATVEFKGYRPREANFYMSPGGEYTQNALRARSPLQRMISVLGNNTLPKR